MSAKRRSLGEMIDREIVAVLLAATIVAVAVLPTNAAALTAWIALFACGIVVVAVRRNSRARAARGSVALFAVGGIAVALAIGSSLAAVNPIVSLFGSLGQHAGSLLWAGALCVAVVVAACARRGDLGRIVRAVAVGSAIVGLSALLDAAGVVSAARFSVEPAGIMENSISLAQVLVLGMFSSAAWGLIRSGRGRVTAWGTGAVAAGALLVADVRAAWVGVALGILFATYTVFTHRRGFVRPVVTGVLVGALLLTAVGVGWVLLGDQEITTFERTLERVSNDRTAIWSSAYAQALEMPLMGEGAEQFSAWVTWSSRPGVSLFKAGAYDPHNVLLWWLLAAGVPGLLVCVFFAALLSVRMHGAIVDLDGSVAVAAVAGGLVAFGGMLLFSWVSPLALFMAAALLGGVLPADTLASEARQDSASGGSLVIASYLAATLSLMALVGVFMLGSPMQEYGWAERLDDGAVDAAFALRAASDSGDPSLAALALTMTLEQAAARPDDADALLGMDMDMTTVIERDSEWHADLAFGRFQLAMAQAGRDSDPAWIDAADAAIEAGKKADPASGLWDYVAAVQFEGLGETQRAVSHARSSLDHDLPVDVRMYLQKLVDGQ